MLLVFLNGKLSMSSFELSQINTKYLFIDKINVLLYSQMMEMETCRMFSMHSEILHIMRENFNPCTYSFFV